MIQRTAYSIVDDSPQPGQNCYRLKQQVFNGGFEHSSVISIDVVAAVNATIVPNPFKESCTLWLSKPIVESGSVRVIDVAGRLVLHEQLEVGTTGKKLGLNHLNSGLYFVTVIVDGNRHVYELIHR
jgi:hypothetical protein